MLPALLKWIGNKGRFAQEIVSLFPEDFNDYYEPFLGSGAVLAELSYEQLSCSNGQTHAYYAGDNLPFLIDIFETVKNDPEGLASYYSEAIREYDENPKEHYLEIRNRFNSQPNGLDFCVLTRTCYSGVIRFRKKDGYMSTPVGAHRPISGDAFRKRALLWHDLIKDVNFTCCDFRELMRKASPGDLIYCDPPYTHSQSIIYGAQDFQIESLWDEIEECKSKGCYIALSINGSRKSGKRDLAPQIPDGLFERKASINCGISMIDRFHNGDKQMLDSEVRDLLLLSW